MDNPQQASTTKDPGRNRSLLGATVILRNLEAAGCRVETYEMSPDLVDVEVSNPLSNRDERARLSIGDTVECSFESPDRARGPLSFNLSDPHLENALLANVIGWLSMKTAAVPAVNPQVKKALP